MTPPDSIEFALWTDDAAIAGAAVAAGVNFVGPDLEVFEKRARQPEPDTRISDHTLASLPRLAKVVPPAQRFARCNPVRAEFQNEIEHLIDAGVRCIMLPMARSVDEVEYAQRVIAGRARLVIMLEQIALIDQLDALLGVPDVYGFYIGTNDLSRSMGYRTRFGAIADGTLERVARRLTASRRRFGFLGLSRDEHEFVTPPPVSPRLALSAMAFLGANWFMFARTFEPERPDFALRFRRCRERIHPLRASEASSLIERDFHEFLLQCSAAERGVSSR